MNRLLLPFVFLASGTAVADDLKPLMTVPETIVLHSDFSRTEPLKKTDWLKRQGTRWNTEDGVLRGIPSTQQYQQSKPDHKGFEPRLSVPSTPAQFAARFRVRFLDGRETTIVPFVEFGHHVCRLRFSSKTGLELIAAGETIRLAKAAEFTYESGKWYDVLAEMKGDEFVIQFKNGPTLYARHSSFADPPRSGGNGLGIAGPRGGTVEVDDLTIWTISTRAQSTWADTKRQLPQPIHEATGKTRKQKQKK